MDGSGGGMSEAKTAKEMVLEVLKREKRPLTPKEIQKLTNLNYNTVRGRLQDLKKAGLAVRTDQGWVYKERRA
jgi:DNA-binding IclR family transcriptional regulator